MNLDDHGALDGFESEAEYAAAWDIPVELFHPIDYSRDIYAVAGETLKAVYDDHEQHLQLHKEYTDMIRQQQDPLDRPLTLRQLVDTHNTLKREKGRTPSFKQTITRLAHDLSQTDYVGVRFSEGSNLYIYRIASQPQRRVQVGDLITVPGVDRWSNPKVVRVSEINSQPPRGIRIKDAVAISPEDAQRIQAVVGLVK